MCNFIYLYCNLPWVTIGVGVDIVLLKDEVAVYEKLDGGCILLVEGYELSILVSILIVVV